MCRHVAVFTDPKMTWRAKQHNAALEVTMEEKAVVPYTCVCFDDNYLSQILHERPKIALLNTFPMQNLQPLPQKRKRTQNNSAYESR